MFKENCYFATLCCLFVTTTTLDLEPSQESINEGKQQYELLSQKAQIPRFGECWTAALEELRRDCRHLDDVTQARLALLFASCFLQTSGLQPISCDEADDVRPCLRRLNDREFDSYREFFTHTQNMCSFLQVQVWHRQTGRLISRLGSEAAAVAERLERSGSVQEDILQAQERALGNQQQLMDQGQRMSKDVDDWRGSLQLMVQDFREQTAEHRDLILTVFERLTSLQQLVLDRFSWFNSLSHYVAGVLLAYLLTSTGRTAGARLWLFLVLTGNLVLERLLAAYFISAASPLHAHSAQQTGALLESSSWLLRRVAASLCLLVLAVTVYRYRDLNAANNQLLLELHRQHRELRACLVARGVPVGDSTDGAATAVWPRGALSGAAGSHLRSVSGLGPSGCGGDLARSASRPQGAAGGDMPNRRATQSARHDLLPRPKEERAESAEEASDSLSVAGDLSVRREVEVPSPSDGAPSLHRRPSLAAVLNGSLQLAAAAVTASPGGAQQVVGSRTGTPQSSPGRYNLRCRPSPAGELQSPASLSRAVHHMEALTEQHTRLVRRALRR